MWRSSEMGARMGRTLARANPPAPVGECGAMHWRGRRRGFFEGPPRVLYARTGPRYMDACALAMVGNGVVVAGFVVVTLVLYVDVSASELALFAAASVASYVVEGIVAGGDLRRAAAPGRAWPAGPPGEAEALRAWTAAARLPVVLLRRPSLYVIGALGAAAVDL